MTQPSKPILLVVGTNRTGAVSEIVARHYGELLAQKDMPHQILRMADLPHDFAFSALYEKAGTNPAFNAIATRMTDADKYVFFIPEYNGSFPGILKTFLDGLPPKSFEKKKCALVGISAGPLGGVMGMSHLVDVFNHLGTQVYPMRIRLAGVKGLEDVLASERYKTMLASQVDGIIAF